MSRLLRQDAVPAWTAEEVTAYWDQARPCWDRLTAEALHRTRPLILHRRRHRKKTAATTRQPR